MSDHPTPLNDDELAKVVGGAGATPSSRLDETSTTDMHSVMKLFQDVAQQSRDSARETRSAEMASQIEGLKQTANDMRDTAHDRMQAAVMAGSMSIAGGMVQSGLVGLGSSLSSGKGAMADTSHDALSAKAGLAHEATAMSSTPQQAGDMQKQMMDVIKDVKDKMSAIEQSRTDTLRNISRGGV